LLAKIYNTQTAFEASFLARYSIGPIPIPIDDLRSKMPAALTFSSFFLLGAYISGAGIGFKINQQLHGDRSSLILSVSPAKIKRSATDQEQQTHHNYRRFFFF